MSIKIIQVAFRKTGPRATNNEKNQQHAVVFKTGGKLAETNKTSKINEEKQKKWYSNIDKIGH